MILYNKILLLHLFYLHLAAYKKGRKNMILKISSLCTTQPSLFLLDLLSSSISVMLYTAFQELVITKVKEMKVLQNFPIKRKL